VSTMRTPGDLIQRFTGAAALPDGTVMFCGTLAAHGGIRPAQRLELEIEDPVRGQRIRHAYDVVSLPASA
jgi:2-keto-4-pentenoate hydratase/2-oxohepta-3-ene-1,7-dioic acid hydratase in catechol pathway